MKVWASRHFEITLGVAMAKEGDMLRYSVARYERAAEMRPTPRLRGRRTSAARSRSWWRSASPPCSSSSRWSSTSGWSGWTGSPTRLRPTPRSAPACVPSTVAPARSTPTAASVGRSEYLDANRPELRDAGLAWGECGGARDSVVCKPGVLSTAANFAQTVTTAGRRRVPGRDQHSVRAGRPPGVPGGDQGHPRRRPGRAGRAGLRPDRRPHHPDAAARGWAASPRTRTSSPGSARSAGSPSATTARAPWRCCSWSGTTAGRSTPSVGRASTSTAPTPCPA